MSYEEIEFLNLFCETCGVQSQCRVLAESVQTDPGQTQDFEGLKPFRRTAFRFSVCNKCSAPFLSSHPLVVIPEEAVTAEQGDPTVLYPSFGPSLPAGVPSNVAKAYADAVLALRAGLPVPSAIMCRKAVEALCTELGGNGSTLIAKLSDLKSRSVIDPKFLAWVDGLRAMGNDAAHDLEASISTQDARDALEFVQAICLYVFSLSRRFDEFSRRRAKGRSE